VVTQGHNVLNNNTKFEFEFEDIEEVTDEDNTEDVTGNDEDEEDEKREAMLTYIDSKSSKYNKVNVFLKGVGLKTNAVKHELHHGARADIIVHGDGHDMAELFGGNAGKDSPGKNPVKSKDSNEGRSMPENVEYETLSITRKKRRIIWLTNHAYHPTVMYIDKVRWKMIRIPSGNIHQSNKIMEKQTV
jgi:hypothetical protein